MGGFKEYGGFQERGLDFPPDFLCLSSFRLHCPLDVPLYSILTFFSVNKCISRVPLRSPFRCRPSRLPSRSFQSFRLDATCVPSTLSRFPLGFPLDVPLHVSLDVPSDTRRYVPTDAPFGFPSAVL